MKKAFREHDYQLGRKNCQTFLRYYFGEEPEIFASKTGVSLTPEQQRQWCYNERYGNQALPKYKMPLIPDMLLLDKPETGEYKDLNQETLAQLVKVRTEIVEPAYDGLTTEQLAEITGSIKARIARITHHSYDDLKQKAANINKLLGFGMKLFPRFIKKKIVKAVTGKVDPYLLKTFSAYSVKQDVLVSKFTDVIDQGGKFYKWRDVTAVIAHGGEKVVSFIENNKSKKEDWNTAAAGEYIVTNGTSRREQYIVAADKFNDRYDLVKDNIYKPNEKARVYALQISADNIEKYQMRVFDKLIASPMNPIYIEPIWKQSQSLYLDDYLVSPLNKDEVYCIKKKDFEETYLRLKEQ